MTFRDFCTALDGKWVKVWTVDGIPGEDGSAMAFCGRLRVHQDFLEVRDDDERPFAIQVCHIVAIVESSDSEAKLLQQLVGSLEVPNGER